MKKIDFLILGVIFLVFYRLFLPGWRVANDFQIISEEVLKTGFNLPQAWSSKWAEGMGEYAVGTLWSYPYDFLYGLGANLGLQFKILQLFLGFIPAIILGFFGIYKLLDYLKITGWGKRVGAFFYIANTYFILLLDGGQINLALAYALLPVAYVYFKKASVEGKSRLKFVLSTLALSIFDIRILYFLLILIVIDILLTISIKNIFSILRLNLLIGCTTLAILLSVHAYWLLPSFLSKPVVLPPAYSRPQQVEELSFATIGHTLYLLQPHWYKNVFGVVTTVNWQFGLIPILAFLAPILLRKDKRVAFWLVVALCSIFLAKGSQESFGEFYKWFFINLPGFTLFRDPIKFYFLIALSYSVLIAITVSEVVNFKFKNKYTQTITKALPITLLIYFTWLIRPVFLGGMTGIFSDQIYEKEFMDISNYLQGDENFSRVLWIPSKLPLSFSSKTHPSVEAFRISQKRPFAQAIRGTYETFNFLREAPYMSELFDVSAIGYVAYPYLDPRRDNLHPDNLRYYYNFSQQLDGLPWLSKVNQLSSFTFLKTENHQPELFITPNIWWVIGSDNLYQKFKNANLKLSENAIIFVEERLGLGRRIDEFPRAKILLNNKSSLDLAATFIDAESMVFPAKELDFAPDQSGWWKRESDDLVSWKEFLRDKYAIENQDFDFGGGWAVGEGSLRLRVNSSLREASEKLKRNNILLARVLESTRSGQLRFYQDEKLIGKINTNQEGDNFRWFEIGKVGESIQPITIESSGDINVVNALAFVETNKWLEYNKEAENLLNKRMISNLKNIPDLDTDAKVSFEKINPTKYKVSISNLKEPLMLIFSQNYDPLWQLNGINALPIYSLLNGYQIDKNGNYELNYQPQRYVNWGLTISGLTVFVLFIVWGFVKNKS